MFDFGIKDLIDILIVAWGMYWLYIRTKESGTFAVFQGILVLLVVWVLVSQVLQMRLLGSLLDNFFGVGLIALVILFQNEIRQVLIRVGSRNRWSSLLKFFNRAQVDAQNQRAWIDPVLLACRNLSSQKVGALICIQCNDDLQAFIQEGDKLDALISTRLIEQIFFKNTPLHDGAMMVRDGRIVSAASILPVSHSSRIPQEFGLRHRAAMGLSEQTDAKIIVVSEETGSITLFWKGKYHRNLSTSVLSKMLERQSS